MKEETPVKTKTLLIGSGNWITKSLTVNTTLVILILYVELIKKINIESK